MKLWKRLIILEFIFILILLFSFTFLFYIYFNLIYLDSGLDSELIQDDVQIGNADKSPTVEDNTHQDETKNGQLGNFFILFLFSI